MQSCDRSHAFAEFTAVGDSFVAGASQQFGADGIHRSQQAFSSPGEALK
jgi:hypothetical protein